MKIHGRRVTIGVFSLLISLALLMHTVSTASALRDFDFNLNQKLKQHNLCTEASECANSGLNVAEMIKGLKQKIYAKVNQQLKQHNLCVDSQCINEGYNQFTLNKIKGNFNQKMEQTNECENSLCGNEGVNELTGNGNTNSKQTIIQTNTCASGATCINSAGNVDLIGNTPRAG